MMAATGSTCVAEPLTSHRREFLALIEMRVIHICIRIPYTMVEVEGGGAETEGAQNGSHQRQSMHGGGAGRTD